MRILVTGGAGFIGSQVVDKYVAAGHDVAVVDNLSTGSRGNLSSSVRLFEHDIRDAALEEVFETFRPAVVNHHAAQANVPASVADPVADASINVLGSLNLLRLSASFGVRKFIYASSGGAMYGEPGPGEIPVPEDAPVKPLSPYGASKASVETWLGVYRRTFGLDYTVLRYANVYGPRQGLREEGAVVAVFSTRMAEQRQVRIDGTGLQTRDFIYVGDCVQANLQALERGSGAAINIGTGMETSVLELFSVLARISNYGHEPQFGPARAGDIMRIALDPARAGREISWAPGTALEEGLRSTFAYFAGTARSIA